MPLVSVAQNNDVTQLLGSKIVITHKTERAFAITYNEQNDTKNNRLLLLLLLLLLLQFLQSESISSQQGNHFSLAMKFQIISSLPTQVVLCSCCRCFHSEETLIIRSSSTAATTTAMHSWLGVGRLHSSLVGQLLPPKLIVSNYLGDFHGYSLIFESPGYARTYSGQV